MSPSGILLPGRLVRSSDHPSEDVIALYALNRLVFSVLADVKEHFLFCQPCQQALRREDEFMRSVIVALKES
jgi:hypothetical protein